MPRPKSLTNESESVVSENQSGASAAVAVPDKAMGLDEMLAVIRGVDEFTEVDDDAIQTDILERMLAAKSWEELTTPQVVEHAKDHLNKPLTFVGARLAKSTVENGSGVYMLIDAVDGGKPILLSCGSSNVMTILAIALARDWLPADGLIKQSEKATKSGYKPLNLLWAPPEDNPF